MVLSAVLAGLLPSFALVGLGGLVRGRLSDNAWTGLDRLNFEILFPALLFTAAAARPIDPAQIMVIGPAVWAIMVLGLVAGFAARRYGPERFLDFAGAWQTAWRFNTAMGFVAVGTLPHVELSQMAIVAGLAVPVANLFAVTALSKGNGLGLASTLRHVALNPFLLASLSGLCVGLSGFTPPVLILDPLTMLAQAAIPVALISLGATMDWSSLARLKRFSAILAGVRLVLLPGVTLGLCLALDVNPALTGLLTAFAALPPASASHVLAGGFGANRETVATLVAQSTLLSALTLPIWLILATLVS